MPKKSKPKVKPTVQKRSLNAGEHGKSRGAPFSEQDPKRRLGDFTGTGEHARQGGRNSGIVGQRKDKSRTD